MKRLLFGLLLFLSVPLSAEFSSKQISEFKGWVDIIEPDMLADGYSPDLLNVYTDMYNAITKREGYSPWFSSALTEEQAVRSLYSYSLQDGTKYLITESSSSIYYSKDGTNTSITAGRNNAYRYTYFTAQDYLYGSNGSDAPIKSSATSCTAFSASNSTGAVNARYIAYWLNRSWWAGIDGQMATLWYSEYLDPMNIQPTNYLNINVQDGDIITGILKTSDNKLKVTKTYSTWEVYEKSSGVFDFRNLSQNIGCLYQTTMDELNGYPVWLSHRGVELYDGSFNLISAPIDNYIKSLRQVETQSGILTQTTAADWGAGSGINIDTTTYSGSVAISSGTTDQQNITLDPALASHYYTNGDQYRQKFIPAVSGDLTRCALTIRKNTTYNPTESGTLTFFITDGSETHLSTATVNYSDLTNYSATYQNLPFQNVSLTAETTYYITLATVTVPSNSVSSRWTWQSDCYARGNLETMTAGTTYWINDSGISTGDLNFITMIGSNTASFTSQSLNAGTGWGTWGTFTAGETKPSGSDIDYYVKVSTYSAGLASASLISVNNNVTIPSSVGPYIQVVSSFTRTDVTVTPKLNDFTINYYANDINVPIGKVYDGRYHLFVSTDNSTKINNIDLVYQKTGEWTVFNGMNVGAACIYRDNLLTGSSDNKGLVYTQFIPDQYNDNGNAYDSYWCSKVFDLDSFANHKIFNSLWLAAKNSGDWNLNVDYRLDGTDSAWTSKSLDLNCSYGYVVGRIPFTMDQPRKGRYFQFRVGNSNANEHFLFKKLSVVFEVEPPL